MTQNVTGQTFGVKNLDALAIGRTPIYPIVTEPVNPTSSIVNYPLYQLWFNSNTDEGWILESFSTLGGIFTANWSKFGHGDLGLETLTGNTGGAVGVDSNYNINTIGATPYTVTGNPSTHTLSWSDNGTIAYQYTANTGVAVPSANNLNIFGATVAAGSTPVYTTGSGSTITTNVQITQALAASDATKIGLGNFYNANFTVDSNGFVQLLPFKITFITHADSPYTVLDTDGYIAADATAGTIEIKLPNAPATSRVIIIKDQKGKSSTNNITVTTIGSVVTVDGETSYLIASNYAAISLIFDGTSYEVF